MLHHRPLETWMRKGAKVQLSNNTGIIRSLVTANPGDTLPVEKQTIVLTVTIQPTGTTHVFPFNPNDISEVKPKLCSQVKTIALPGITKAHS